LAFVFLAALMLIINRKAFHEKPRDILNFAGIGLLMAVVLSLYNAANAYGPVQNAVLLSFSSPIFVMIFAKIILKEKITRTKIITIGIAFLGLIIINPLSSGPYFKGNSFAILNAIGFGLIITLMRREDKKQDIGEVMWFFFFASLFLLPFAVTSGLGNYTEALWQILAIGIISTGMAYLLMNLAMQKIEAEISSIITLIITPLMAIVWAVLFLGEAINVKILVGGSLLIVAGLFMEIRTIKKK